MTRRATLTVILALASILFFVDLGGTSIWDANEAFYVETPREMLEAHDLINPTFDYEPRFNKPVLSYWVVAAFYKLFGVSVAVQRIPIAIGALIIVACAFFLARAAADAGLGRGTRDPGPETRDSGRATRDERRATPRGGLRRALPSRRAW